MTRRRKRDSPRSNSCFPTIIRPKKSASGCKGNGLTQALFNLPPGNWDAGEKGFAALPERFDDLKKSLDTALPYAQATGVKRLHLMAGIADRSDSKAVEAFYKSVAWAAEFFAPARPRRRDRADQPAQRARLFPQRFSASRAI